MLFTPYGRGTQARADSRKGRNSCNKVKSKICNGSMQGRYIIMLGNNCLQKSMILDIILADENNQHTQLEYGGQT